ncbi:uncharacterized protein LOC134177107 isoform X2 [Corticium candelabrum]|uniref:uncharacterized protein LOC134177107 isoform X2 n=1 Tax=Corticium candelabrum TaxID=121492 RepID=UPI002E259246|nr:uncharacterized protein LOC134177107 isoform X2 [Corticium candelabrum]
MMRCFSGIDLLCTSIYKRLKQHPTLLFAIIFLHVFVCGEGDGVSVWLNGKASSGAAVAGENVKFFCVWNDDDRPVVVTRWELDGRELTMNYHVRMRPSRTKHILVIVSVRLVDNGTYSCVADRNGTEVTASQSLTVYHAANAVASTSPKTTMKPKSTSVLPASTKEAYHSITTSRTSSVFSGTHAKLSEYELLTGTSLTASRSTVPTATSISVNANTPSRAGSHDAITAKTTHDNVSQDGGRFQTDRNNSSCHVRRKTEIPTFTIVILALGCLFSVASGVVCVVVKVNGIWSWRKTSVERDEDKERGLVWRPNRDDNAVAGNAFPTRFNVSPHYETIAGEKAEDARRSRVPVDSRPSSCDARGYMIMQPITNGERNDRSDSQQPSSAIAIKDNELAISKLESATSLA